MSGLSQENRKLVTRVIGGSSVSDSNLNRLLDAARAEGPPPDADLRERVARKPHAAFTPFADNSYPWDDPLSSQRMFYVLADSILSEIGLGSQASAPPRCQTVGDVIDQMEAAWGRVRIGMDRRQVFDAGWAAGFSVGSALTEHHAPRRGEQT